MPTLSRTFRWERFEPHLGNNLELPPKQRFYLEVASGLSKAQLEAFGKAHQAALKGTMEESVGPMAAELAPYVRLGAEPLIVDGQAIDTLEKYVGLVLGAVGLFNLIEVTQAVVDFNSINGSFSHFSAWRSGGTSGTRAGSAAPATAQTGGQ